MSNDSADVFSRIYLKNGWGNVESRSGPGSTREATKFLVAEMQYLIRQYNIKSILDIPCGDFNWMSGVNLSGINYTGADIVPDLIALNKSRFPQHVFMQLDVVNDDLPSVDLIFCRDCLFHFPNEMILKSLKNVKSSGSRFLMTTSFTWKSLSNCDIKLGQWRRLNLELEPFCLPRPLETIVEGTWRDKAMGFWALGQLSF